MMVITILACYYITWVITASRFPLIALPRDKFINRWATWDASNDPEFVPDPKKSITDKPTNLLMRSLAYLSECAWCMGFWVALGYHAILGKWGSVPFSVQSVLATAAGVGIASTIIKVIGSWEREE